jgi:hypothetical protein
MYKVLCYSCILPLHVWVTGAEDIGMEERVNTSPTCMGYWPRLYYDLLLRGYFPYMYGLLDEDVDFLSSRRILTLHVWVTGSSQPKP